MFTLTLSSYFGSPGESWLHINVVINWQLSKQGIRWPVSADRIAGSGVDPSRTSIFLKLSAYKLLVFKWSLKSGARSCQVYYLLIHMEYAVFMSLWPGAIKILISNWPRTRKFSQLSKNTDDSLRSRRLEVVGTRKNGRARRRHAKGEGAPARKAPENRFSSPLQLPGSRCVICQKFWQKTSDLAQTKCAAKKRCTFSLRSKYICCKDQLGFLIIER